MTSKDNLDFLKNRIRALQAKTVANGCTEEEALAAAAKAAELMDKYDLSLSDLEVRNSEFREHQHQATDDVGQRLWKVASAIATLTGTKTWVDGMGAASEKVYFFGRDSDVAIAAYLLAIVERAMHTEVAAFEKKWQTYLLTTVRRRSKRAAFLDGMATSLRDKIYELHRARQKQTGSTGLVVLKNEMITEELARQGRKFTSLRGGLNRDFDPSYDHGKEAGDRVRLDPGLGTTTAAGVLGMDTDEDVA